MAKRFLTNIDLSKNEIQNVVIHKLATAPSSPVEGQIYYNTTDERFYLRQSSAWKDVTGRLDDLLTTTNAITISDNNNGTLDIDIANATQSDAGLLSAADKTKLDGATNAATADTLVERDSNGDFAGNRITANDITINNAPVNGTDAVNKNYVDGLVSSGMKIIGSIDCSTNPDYPSADKGDAYYVSVDGKIGGASGEDVHVGDLMVAVQNTAGGDEATVGDDWIVMERNQEYATETTSGYIRIATTPEVNAGTDDTTAVTPAKMKAYIDANPTTAGYAADIGDNAATTFIVNHQLNSQDVLVAIYDNSTLEDVEADVVRTDIDNVTITFTQAPTTDAYRVTIKG